MREIKQNDRIELLLPATRELMLVVRLATAGVVARAGLTIDVLDDVKMAVEEACMYMMTQVPEAARLKLEFGLGEKEIEVSVACEICGSCRETRDDEDAELEVVRCILESLVEKVEICREGTNVRGIRLKASTVR